MRIGIVVDSACDLPQDFIQRHNVIVLPISVRIGKAVLADHRDGEATLSFLQAHVAERGHEAETTPFSVNQIRDLFLQQLVIDYDHVFCLTISKLRSQIFDNAMQAGFAILNDYKPIRDGLMTPTVCVGYGGELAELHALPGYAAACQSHGLELLESVMSLTGMLNVGKGALAVGFAAEPHTFSA
ncbi:hypothetical protein XAXN_05245 [Xanthomonas axonopodis]|uniref:Fatty acid-binding protein DegV n=1 Tax=Xanthomonas axonopodis TaxID=53413 RepID=A0A0P6VT61_9XANT|nr:DegV family protein [Xanthomonas axonopodis]KPL49820.1 hypothetical protein XAXN_05245 [Xanthomonas axonopodis]